MSWTANPFPLDFFYLYLITSLASRPLVLLVQYSAQGGSKFWVCWWNPEVAIQMNVSEQNLPVVLFIMLYKVILTFESADKIPMSDP